MSGCPEQNLRADQRRSNSPNTYTASFQEKPSQGCSARQPAEPQPERPVDDLPGFTRSFWNGSFGHDRPLTGALVVGIVAAYFVVNFYRGGAPRPRISYSAKDQSYLALTARDDYQAVVRKLGAPARDRWQRETGAIRYRALSYTERACTVILMDAGHGGASYIGTLDEHWKPLHAVELQDGASTDSLLRALPRF